MFYNGMSNIRPVIAALPATETRWAIAGFELTLGQTARPGRHLRARCRCGRHGPVNPEYWLSRRWAHRPLSELEDRLRCTCGQRRVMLEMAVGPVRPGHIFYMPP
jgi:hypothetical protein